MAKLQAGARTGARAKSMRVSGCRAFARQLLCVCARRRKKKKQEVIASRPMLGMPGGIQAQAQYTGAPPAPTALFVQASDRGSPTRKPPSPFGLRAPPRTMDGSGGGSSKSGFWSQRGLPGFSMTIPENKIKNPTPEKPVRMKTAPPKLAVYQPPKRAMPALARAAASQKNVQQPVATPNSRLSL